MIYSLTSEVLHFTQLLLNYFKKTRPPSGLCNCNWAAPKNASPEDLPKRSVGWLCPHLVHQAAST